jgi:hypothetical protein
MLAPPKTPSGAPLKPVTRCSPFGQDLPDLDGIIEPGQPRTDDEQPLSAPRYAGPFASRALVLPIAASQMPAEDIQPPSTMMVSPVT